ncbi:hypothetical protein SK128_027808, partial [Halocaridina rubra]
DYIIREVWKYIKKGLLFKVSLITNKAINHPKSIMHEDEYNDVLLLPQHMMSLLQRLEQGFKSA